MKLSVSNKLNTYFSASLNSGNVQKNKKQKNTRAPFQIQQTIHKFKFHTENADVFLKAQSAMCFLDENAVDTKKILFFDVECVDLSFGPNNVPFLLGLGYYKNNHFIVEQIFLENPFNEDSMLSFLDDFWQKFDYLVTYNGKSFDVPLIKSRFRFFQKEYPEHFLRHFDLYHILRRIFPQKRSRLVDYENSVLNIQRKDDLPGSQAGQAYFEYQKKQNKSLIERLKRHNESDILSLAALAVKLDEAVKKAFNAKTGSQWATKIYKLKKPVHDPDFILANISTKASLDAEDMYYMAMSYKKKKDYIKAYHYFKKSYKKGISKALPEAVLVLYFYLKEFKKALNLIEKYLPVEEASVQDKLLAAQSKILKKIKS